jgi:hypothetical protein
LSDNGWYVDHIPDNLRRKPIGILTSLLDMITFVPVRFPV